MKSGKSELEGISCTHVFSMKRLREVYRSENYPIIILTRSSSLSVGLGMADVRPAFRLVAAIV